MLESGARMALQIGQQLGNYRLVSLLGHGGFADVYLGEHIHLKTRAAIKVLHTQLASEDVEKFRNEALTIAHLVHPHIIRVLDYDVENSIPFLVMDYAPNGSLRERHPKGTRLSPMVFMPYVKQVASALQYAHDLRLVHRDVKPENMLLGRNNEVLLSDFGIALVTQSSLTQSTEDVVIGTMAYMAPEQIQGKARPASDQYALGVVVYEWLSGMRPFNGSYVEIVTQHLTAAPPPLNEQALAIPHAVQQVVQRALAKDPHQRFPRVRDFADALEQAYQVQQRPIVVAPTVQAYQAKGASAATQVDQSRRPVHTVYPPLSPVATGAPSFVPPAAKKLGRGLKRGFRVLAILLVLSGLLVCGLGYAAFHWFTVPGAPPSSAGATALASDFVQAVSNRNYDQAYNDLGSQITKQTSRSQFIQDAQCEDSSYGAVTGYKSVGTTSQGNSLRYSYQVTREKLSQPYQLHLTVQQNSSGSWQVTDYSSDLSPPACH